MTEGAVSNNGILMTETEVIYETLNSSRHLDEDIPKKRHSDIKKIINTSPRPNTTPLEGIKS
jgi:hypothetical protein